MYLSVIIDAAALAVLALFARLGYKRGLVRTLSELIVVVLAMILAGKIADVAAVQVIERMRPAAHAAVEERVDAMLAEGDACAAPEEIERKLLDVAEGLPEFLQGYAQEAVKGLTVSAAQMTQSARETLVRLGIEAVDKALGGAVYRSVHAALYAAAFAAGVFLLRLGMRAVFMVMKLPGLRQADHFCGLLVGLGKGLLLVWLAGWILPLLVEIPPEVREGSFLLRHTAFTGQGTFLAKLLSLPGVSSV